MFEGTCVPLIFEQSLVPKGADPDGLGPLSDIDRRLRIEFEMVCKRDPGWRPQLKRLCRELFKLQKYQLQNTYAIADNNGERADNMDIEDICPWLEKLGVLTAFEPDYVVEEDDDICLFEIEPWVFEVCEREGIYLELIEAVREWSDDGCAFETTPYPGIRAIDGDGNYPVFQVPKPDPLLQDLIETLSPEFASELQGLKRTQSKSFTDYQWPKGHCPNKAGRPRRIREVEDIDDSRPHFFDTLMPPDSEGKSMTYGEALYLLSRRRASETGDWEWIAKTDQWARELAVIRMSRKTISAGGYVYTDRLDVTRIDIAIRHLGLVDILWRKSPAARWVINPWLVSAALERAKKGSLDREDMEGIYLRTKTPQHVDWPKWWPEDLKCKHSENTQLVHPRRQISGTIRKE
jgi:hypothetical protein